MFRGYWISDIGKLPIFPTNFHWLIASFSTLTLTTAISYLNAIGTVQHLTFDSVLLSWEGEKTYNVHSLKLTAKAPENRPGPKRKLIFQPSIFRCYVSGTETNPGGDWNPGWLVDPTDILKRMGPCPNVKK